MAGCEPLCHVLVRRLATDATLDRMGSEQLCKQWIHNVKYVIAAPRVTAVYA